MSYGNLSFCSYFYLLFHKPSGMALSTSFYCPDNLHAISTNSGHMYIFERLNLPVLILWSNWERGELHFPCSSLPTEWVTEVPDSELSECSQALCNEHSKLAEAVISLLSLMFLLRFVPCKGWSLEDGQNAEGIIGAIWGQEVELGQGAWWGPKLAPLCKHLTLWALITRLPSPDPAPFCAQNLF